MAEERRLSTLRRKRGNIQAAITNFTKILDSWRDNRNQRDPYYLQAAYESLQKTFSHFSDIQDEIEELDIAEVSKREAFQSNYDLTVARVRRYLKESEIEANNETRSLSTPTIRPTPSVTLPAITLPKFDGKPENWASFFDLFASLIDKNEDLAPVRKLQYLRLSLSENAAYSIQSLETTDANYEIALDILKKKYECTRRILHRHWIQLREYPSLQKDSPAEISKLIDTIQQHIRALETLGAPTTSWDIPLIDLILMKVSRNTAWQWELTLNDNKMLSYKNLISFLEKRASCVDFSSTNENVPRKSYAQRRDIQHPRKPDAHTQAFVTSNAAKETNTPHSSCVYCTEAHLIYYCEKFKSLPQEERQKAVANACLCFNCLKKGHGSSTCRSEISCRKCRGRHHTLLHRSPEIKKLEEQAKEIESPGTTNPTA
ncbi:uncharacterized protein [Venturia canescens]|uniref:uncharacterized protein n=1 Tax=Venturia canescens TaxID=32260 RepID=UPI001C9CD926|nr:uncharacterized protein LOC122417768 [Venturia canescens]